MKNLDPDEIMIIRGWLGNRKEQGETEVKIKDVLDFINRLDEE